jgi:hypothetical protein
MFFAYKKVIINFFITIFITILLHFYFKKKPLFAVGFLEKI